MNFEESVQYLYSLGNEVLAMKLGLENPKRLFQALGNPHEKYLKVQIAGTNGKGSTCAFLDSICRQTNIKTGLYTSPHLVSITERIKVDGEEISEEDFAKYATKVREATESEKLYATFFEQMTAIALLAFAANKVELAILETGLGGRLDATTAAHAEIVAITPIDYDHQQYLGETLSEIASEKAAIINSESQKVILAKQSYENAADILNKRCEKFGIKPYPAIFRNYPLPEKKNGKFCVSFLTRNDSYYDVCPNLLGEHQIENAKTAVCLGETLREMGLTISKENIINGLETAIHKGRLEYYKGILFDGAHNIAGAKALREYLEEFIKQPITLIFGAMKDKQISEIAEILFPVADKLILTKPNNSRSATAEELSVFAKRDFIVSQSVRDALVIAQQFSENLTCVTGSLYLVGEVQKLLEKNV